MSEVTTWKRPNGLPPKQRTAGRPCTYTAAQAFSVLLMLSEGVSKRDVGRAVGLPRHTVDNIHRRVQNGKSLPTEMQQPVRLDQQPHETKDDESRGQ